MPTEKIVILCMLAACTYFVAYITFLKDYWADQRRKEEERRAAAKREFDKLVADGVRHVAVGLALDILGGMISGPKGKSEVR